MSTSMIKAVIEAPGILLMSLGKLPRMTLMPVRKRTKDYHDHHSKHFKVPKDHNGCRVNGMCYGRYVETFWPSFLSVELTIYFLSRLIVIFVFSFSPKLSTRSQIVIDALKIAGNDSMYIYIHTYIYIHIYIHIIYVMLNVVKSQANVMVTIPQLSPDGIPIPKR